MQAIAGAQVFGATGASTVETGDREAHTDFRRTTAGKMTPGILHEIPEERNLEKQIERQMGCMAGFLQLFDRQQSMAGIRFFPSKRLPSYPAAVDSPSNLSDASPISFVKTTPPSAENLKPSLTLPLHVFEVKDGVRTLGKLRESPRLSLDSRAVVDTRGKLRPRQIRTTPADVSGDQSECSEAAEDTTRLRRSPSVVARLMGLEALPDAEMPKRPELRRSASESRVSCDSSQFNFQKPSPVSLNESFREPKHEPPPASPAPLQRKCFFDALEFFPEPKRTDSIFGEIEKRLRMRGIEESSKDLDTLKQILEALQLKGLLRTNLPAVMKSPSKPLNHRSVSPRQPAPPARSPRDLRGLSSPICSPLRPRPFNAQGQSPTQFGRRIPTVHSPRDCPKRSGSDQVGSRSPKNRRPKAEISSMERVCSSAEDYILSSPASPANFDFQFSRTGRGLLERCDKLLHSIAAITSSAEQVTATDPQPSPVSVLDSSFLCEESSAASPLLDHSIFKEQLTNCEDHRRQNGTPTVESPSQNGHEEEHKAGLSDDYDYVANVILKTNGCGRGAADVFSAIEQCRHFSNGSLLHRQLIFDVVAEIVCRKRNVIPWFALTAPPAGTGSALLPEVWEEVRWLREPLVAENVIDLTGKMVRQDMAQGAAGEQEWAVPGVDLSEAVLHIERMLFKDIVADTIRELTVLSSSRRPTSLPRRKLIF